MLAEDQFNRLHKLTEAGSKIPLLEQLKTKSQHGQIRIASAHNPLPEISGNSARVHFALHLQSQKPPQCTLPILLQFRGKSV